MGGWQRLTFEPRWSVSKVLPLSAPLASCRPQSTQRSVSSAPGEGPRRAGREGRHTARGDLSGLEQAKVHFAVVCLPTELFGAEEEGVCILHWAFFFFFLGGGGGCHPTGLTSPPRTSDQANRTRASRQFSGSDSGLPIQEHGPPCTDDERRTPGSFPTLHGDRGHGKDMPGVGFLPAARTGLGPSSLLEHPALCTTKDKTDIRPESLEIGDWATGP